MLILVVSLHIIISLLLITVILMQSGRGGGLTAGLAAGAESIFGSKTNVFMVKATTVLAMLFLLTTLSLAYLSTQRNRSLMEKRATPEVGTAATQAAQAGKEKAVLPQPEETQKEDIVPTPVKQNTK